MKLKCGFITGEGLNDYVNLGLVVDLPLIDTTTMISPISRWFWINDGTKLSRCLMTLNQKNVSSDTAHFELVITIANRAYTLVISASPRSSYTNLEVISTSADVEILDILDDVTYDVTSTSYFISAKDDGTNVDQHNGQFVKLPSWLVLGRFTLPTSNSLITTFVPRYYSASAFPVLASSRELSASTLTKLLIKWVISVG